MIKRIVFFYFIFFSTHLSSQRLVKITANTRVCAAEGDETPKDRYVQTASTESQETINEICRKIGASPKGFTIQAANVKNAEALILEGKRYIHYNPLYLNKIQKDSKTYWAMIYVLAHEVGHHINFHTLDSVNMDKRSIEELEADKFAGCALKNMGATMDDLEKAALALSENGDKVHPPRSARLTSAVRGYEDCGIKTPLRPKPCEKTIGDVYFKNMTNRQVRVHTSPQSGWYDQNNFITIDPGETKGYIDLKAGKQAFAIRIQNNFGFSDYKNEEIRIQPCANESQQPIIIR